MSTPEAHTLDLIAAELTLWQGTLANRLRAILAGHTPALIADEWPHCGRPLPCGQEEGES